MGEDWYERRDELEEGQVYSRHYGEPVKLDRRVAGDGTKWFVATWAPCWKSRDGQTGGGYFAYDDGAIEPGDLKNRLPDDYAGEPVIAPIAADHVLAAGRA